MFVRSSATLLMALALVSVTTANSVSTDEQNCPKICPLLYGPVCAWNGKMYKEFVNECQLKVSNCRLERSALQKFVDTDMDWCTTELVADLNELVKKLDNLDLQIPECMKPCSMIYRPVCVSNGKYRALVSNQCVMDNFNCALAKKGKIAFKVIQQESC